MIYSTIGTIKNMKNKLTILLIKRYLNYFGTFLNLFGSNKLIEDNKAILWLSEFGWINCDGVIVGGGGGGGGGGVTVRDEELSATTT